MCVCVCFQCVCVCRSITRCHWCAAKSFHESNVLRFGFLRFLFFYIFFFYFTFSFPFFFFWVPQCGEILVGWLGWAAGEGRGRRPTEASGGRHMGRMLVAASAASLGRKKIIAYISGGQQPAEEFIVYFRN